MATMETGKHRPQHTRAGKGKGDKELREECIAMAETALRWDLRLSFAFRFLVGAFALAAGVMAVVYTWQRADAMVAILRAPRTTEDMVGDRLLALSIPVLILLGLAAFGTSVALTVHKRGMDETWQTLDAINRIHRENEVAVSARGLTHSFEEKIDNATRAFRLMLWLGRTLFIVCLGLFTLAVLNAAANGIDILTVALGAMSLGGALLGVARDIPRTLTKDLANVVQIQAIVTGCDRQISLLESYAFHAMNRQGLDPDIVKTRVLDTQEHLDRVVQRAVTRIQKYADPAGEVSASKARRPAHRGRLWSGRRRRRPQRHAVSAPNGRSGARAG